MNVSSEPFFHSRANTNHQSMESSANMDDNFLILSDVEDSLKRTTPVFDRSKEAGSHNGTPICAYVCIDPLHAEELELYQDIGRDTPDMLTYEEVKSWGKIIFEGEGVEPPEDVKAVVEDEWFSLVYPEIEFVDISSSGQEEDASSKCIVSTQVTDSTFYAKGDSDIGEGFFVL